MVNIIKILLFVFRILLFNLFHRCFCYVILWLKYFYVCSNAFELSVTVKYLICLWLFSFDIKISLDFPNNCTFFIQMQTQNNQHRKEGHQHHQCRLVHPMKTLSPKSNKSTWIHQALPMIRRNLELKWLMLNQTRCIVVCIF